jgi:hypothetical protein
MNAAVLLFAALIATPEAQGTAAAPQKGTSQPQVATVTRETDPGAATKPTVPETKPPIATAPPDSKPSAGAKPVEGKPPAPPTEDRSIAGQGVPAVILSPTQTVVDVRVRLPVDEASFQKRDLKAGLLTSTSDPDLRILPGIEVTSDVKTVKPTDSLDVTISGLVAFGELTVPLYYGGRQVETLRFHKPGLIVKRPGGGDTIAQQENDSLLIVLENPSAEDYQGVAARVRFQEVDECRVTPDQPGGKGKASGQTWWNWIRHAFRRAPEPGDCVTDENWSTFAVRRSSQVSLMVPLHDAWFEDVESGLTRTARRQGLLTLRYERGPSSAPANASGPRIVEQNIPIEVRFDARSGRLFISILRIFIPLLLGALFFLLLRVSIPNFRRKRALKDGLNEARTAAARVSDQVDSQLRVLLRVERLTLDQQRRQGWVLLPGFDEIAKRVEAGLAVLNRKIALVERLDAASCRRENLASGPVAPTRLEIIDRNLDSACETLKTDQLGEADWLSIQQQLEAADKALNEPSPQEKQAFEALLSQRWQSIRKHFANSGGRGLHVPDELTAFKKCFPKDELLPELDDENGTGWIDRVGLVRADLQLTALELLREAHFAAPALNDAEWRDATARLAGWLATPAIANLGPARQQLQQVCEGICEKEIVCALERKETHIDMDPQFVSPNETVRLTVRFRNPKLNTAVARQAVQCEWKFEEASVDAEATKRPSIVARLSKSLQRLWSTRERDGNTDAVLPGKTDGVTPAPMNAVTEAAKNAATQGAPNAGTQTSSPQTQAELGWRVHRYFQPDVTVQQLSVRFFYKGALVKTDEQHYSKVVQPTERIHNRKDRNERWLRFGFQALQMVAVLLVPLVTLTMTTANEAVTGEWWDLVSLGFGSEAIRGILTGGDQEQTATPTP